jgi:mRNA interferase RelE/StbE
MVVVRLTEPAMADLETMRRKGDTQVVRWALKKCLILERDPEAGDELRGGLIGFRKIAVGDRDWRVVWRVSHDQGGRTVVDVAEVWVVVVRSDAEVYDEVQQRVSTLKGQPRTIALADALEQLGRVTSGLEAAADPVDERKAPPWLRHVLTSVVRMPADEVARLSPEQAQAVWDACT